MVVANKTQDPEDSNEMDAPFSSHTLFIISLCIYMIAAGAFATFGLVSNVINVNVFFRQGILSSSSTVHLTGLSVSDFLNCLMTLARIISLYFVHFSVGGFLPSTDYSMSLLFSYYIGPFVQMTCWITAFMAFERVISVLFPFAVKTVFTPPRSMAMVIVIFIGTLIIDSPTFLRVHLINKVNPITNISYSQIDYTDILSDELYKTWSLVSPTILRFSAIFIVIVCNIILFWRVSLSQKFRKSTGAKSGNANSEDTTQAIPKKTKEMKLLRMITVISFVFTLCYIVRIPYVVLFEYVLEPYVEYHLFQHHITWEAVGLAETINSSVNIIIYYNMSAKYNEIFKTMLCFDNRTNKNKANST